jgi:hypothetical protein
MIKVMSQAVTTQTRLHADARNAQHSTGPDIHRPQYPQGKAASAAPRPSARIKKMSKRTQVPSPLHPIPEAQSATWVKSNAAAACAPTSPRTKAWIFATTPSGRTTTASDHDRAGPCERAVDNPRSLAAAHVSGRDDEQVEAKPLPAESLGTWCRFRTGRVTPFRPPRLSRLGMVLGNPHHRIAHPSRH